MEDRYRIIVAPRAAKDIEGIIRHAPAASVEFAPEMMGRVLSELESLKLFPKRNIVPGQGNVAIPVRTITVLPYVVYFEVDDRRAAVTILRVRHGARRPLKRFR